VSSTVKAASLLAAGQATVAGLISVKAAALTEGVVMTMLLNKIKAVTIVLLIATIVGGAGLFYRSQAAEPAEEAPKIAASQTAEEEPPSDRDAQPGSSEQGSRNLLSRSPWPRQALVGLDKGQLVVQTLDVMFVPTAVQFQREIHTSYEKTEILRTNRYRTDMVKVFDVSGKSINKKEFPQLLKKETVALVSTDVHAADPLNLRLFKEGTLLFVLPSPDPEFNAPRPVAHFPPPVADNAPPAIPAGAEGAAPPPQAVGDPPIASFPKAPLTPPYAVQEVHTRDVRIPVRVASEGRAALQHLHLFASANEGKTWERVETISPDADSFVFHAPKDGLYWLVVQTVGRDGRAHPSNLTGTVRPQFKLLVKTGNDR
jgi:hypothetical protein